MKSHETIFLTRVSFLPSANYWNIACVRGKYASSHESVPSYASIRSFAVVASGIHARTWRIQYSRSLDAYKYMQMPKSEFLHACACEYFWVWIHVSIGYLSISSLSVHPFLFLYALCCNHWCAYRLRQTRAFTHTNTRIRKTDYLIADVLHLTCWECLPHHASRHVHICNPRCQLLPMPVCVCVYVCKKDRGGIFIFLCVCNCTFPDLHVLGVPHSPFVGHQFQSWHTHTRTRAQITRVFWVLHQSSLHTLSNLHWRWLGRYPRNQRNNFSWRADYQPLVEFQFSRACEKGCCHIPYSELIVFSGFSLARDHLLALANGRKHCGWSQASDIARPIFMTSPHQSCGSELSDDSVVEEGTLDGPTAIFFVSFIVLVAWTLLQAWIYWRWNLNLCIWTRHHVCIFIFDTINHATFI